MLIEVSSTKIRTATFGQTSEIKAFGIDDVLAALPAIIAFAKTLKDLFGNDQRDYTEDIANIGIWMGQVNERLDTINQTLVDIRKLLADLQVHIDASFSADVEKEVSSCIESYVTNLPALKANPQSQLIIRRMDDLYGRLQINAGKLRRYGPVNVYTMFTAFRVEMDLAEVLALGKATRNNIAQIYADYFRNCGQEDLSGSIAYILNEHRAAKDNLQGQYVAGDKGFAGPPFWFKENCRERRSGSLREPTYYWSCDYWRIHPAYKILGDIENGFNLEIIRSDEHNYNDSSRGDGEYLDGRSAALAAAESYARDNLLPAYRSANANFLKLKMYVQMLEEVTKHCQEFKDVATSYRVD